MRMLGTATGMFAAASFALLCAAPPLSQAQAQESSDLQRIIETKTVRVGAVESFPNYKKDLKSDKWIGIIPDFVELMFSSIGVTVEYVPTDWGTAAAALQAGRFDLIGAYGATPVRALAVSFTEPVFYAGLGVLSLNEPPESYGNWETLNTPEFNVGAVEGANSTRSAQRMLPDASWTLLRSYESLLMELESGRVEAIVSTEQQLMLYQAARKSGYVTVPERIISSPSNIAVRKGSDELRDWLNVAINYYRQQGDFAAIEASYLEGNLDKDPTD